MIPFHTFTEIPPRKDNEHAKRDHLLNDFQLKRREFSIADTICGNLETVFSKRDQPTHHDYKEKWGLSVFQVTVPSNGHEDVRTNQKQDGSHKARMVPRAKCGVAAA
jgi:hypothetical protein